jgi:hypothetical protein
MGPFVTDDADPLAGIPVTRADVAAGLAAWAAGDVPATAAVQLLVEALGGRFVAPGQPWVRGDADSGWWLDAEAVADAAASGALSGGERRVLAVVASLLGSAVVRLDDVLTGLDEVTAAAVVRAVERCAGVAAAPLR